MNRYIIVGNPNTGKTTLFNTLTRSKEKTANWSGVTVREKCKNTIYNGNQIELIDLPGLYSLNTSGEDEQVARNFLEKNKDATIIFTCASNTINKNLLLFSELIKKKFNIKLLINNFGGAVDSGLVKKAEQLLGIPVMQADVRKNRSKLLSWIVEEVSCRVNEFVNIGEVIGLFDLTDAELQKLDKLLLRPVVGKLIFLILLFSIMFISYGPIGAGISAGLEKIFFKYTDIIYSFLVSRGLVVVGDYFNRVIVGAVLTLFIYLPQLVLMLSLLYILEDVGFLPRVAYLFNLDMKKFGMNGKSVFSLMVGVGCTTSAILVTRNIEDKGLKVNTGKLLPFIGCSAKIPIFLIVSSILFSKLGTLFVALVLITGFIIGFTYLKLTNKKTNDPYFICELPRLKRPDVKRATLESIRIAMDFIKKVVLSVFLVASIMWVFLSIDTSFKFLTGNTSLLEWVVERVAFVFAPIGLDDTTMIIALISGLIAKENIISSIGLFGGFGEFNFLSLSTFLIFLLLYSPCIPALKCARCEFGKGFAVKLFINQSLIAYFCSFVFYNFGRLSIWLGFLSLYVMVFLVLVYSGCKDVAKIKAKKLIKHA